MKKDEFKSSSKRKVYLSNNSSKGQRRRLEQALRDNPQGLTTIELMERFDIMRPGARICEMRWEEGLNIKTVQATAVTAQGYSHSNARYVLMPGIWRVRQ